MTYKKLIVLILSFATLQDDFVAAAARLQARTHGTIYQSSDDLYSGRDCDMLACDFELSAADGDHVDDFPNFNEGKLPFGVCIEYDFREQEAALNPAFATVFTLKRLRT